MRNQMNCRVVGFYANGKRIVLTKNTTREIAEQIVDLMKPGSVFADLRIEADDEEIVTTDE
jgi:hypothetical protein